MGTTIRGSVLNEMCASHTLAPALRSSHREAHPTTFYASTERPVYVRGAVKCLRKTTVLGSKDLIRRGGRTSALTEFRS
jgi:hypothetical protein